jgi:N-acetyl-gamma-glutamylphosphate reductase
MRVLVIGAGRTGIKVIRQLRKNPAITVLTADPRPEPEAVRAGLIGQVDVTDVITPLTLEEVLDRTGAEVAFLAMPAEEMGLGKAPGVDILADALLDEIASISKVPMIEVARSAA